MVFPYDHDNAPTRELASAPDSYLSVLASCFFSFALHTDPMLFMKFYYALAFKLALRLSMVSKNASSVPEEDAVYSTLTKPVRQPAGRRRMKGHANKTTNRYHNRHDTPCRT